MNNAYNGYFSSVLTREGNNLQLLTFLVKTELY